MARPFSPPSLIALRAEADRRAPRRSTASDGWLGDAAHRKRKSDHNPLPDGAVLARDLTHDPDAGLDAHGWARDVAARGDERVSYLISDGEIWNPPSQAWATYRRLRAEGANRRDAARMALGWRRYRGSNPHKTHVHGSIKNTPAARNDMSPWWPEDDHDQEDDEMASIDYRRGLVRQLYLQLFGRHPESAEVQEFWAEHIRARGYDATVQALADSDEARARRGA
jgi:hypothetical protein